MPWPLPPPHPQLPTSNILFQLFCSKWFHFQNFATPKKDPTWPPGGEGPLTTTTETKKNDFWLKIVKFSKICKNKIDPTWTTMPHPLPPKLFTPYFCCNGQYLKMWAISDQSFLKYHLPATLSSSFQTWFYRTILASVQKWRIMQTSGRIFYSWYTRALSRGKKLLKTSFSIFLTIA